jgi:hypothetical protein
MNVSTGQLGFSAPKDLFHTTLMFTYSFSTTETTIVTEEGYET